MRRLALWIDFVLLLVALGFMLAAMWTYSGWTPSPNTVARAAFMGASAGLLYFARMEWPR